MKEKIMILLVAFLAGHISVTSTQTANRQSMSLTSEVCIPSGGENIFGVLSKPAKTESNYFQMLLQPLVMLLQPLVMLFQLLVMLLQPLGEVRPTIREKAQ